MNLSPNRSGGCGISFDKAMVKLLQDVDRLVIAAGFGWDISAMLSFFWLPAFCHMVDSSCGMEMVGRGSHLVVGRFGSGKSLTYFSNLPLYDLRIWAAGKGNPGMTNPSRSIRDMILWSICHQRFDNSHGGRDGAVVGAERLKKCFDSYWLARCLFLR